jgi:MYND finger
VLVRRARLVFEQALLRNKDSFDPFLMEAGNLSEEYNFKGKRIKTLIHNMGVWQFAHNLTDEELWEFFEDSCVVGLEGANSVAFDRRLIKDARKRCKKKVRQVAGLHSGEMCANCFVLEKTLLEEAEEEDNEGGEGNNGLMKCSQCLQIKYCSVECQR